MQKISTRRTNQERSQATRAALVTAARQLFEVKGYAKTATPEVVEAAGITRGALYHHFVDKDDLFMAVALQAAEEVASSIAKSSESTQEPMAALRAGAQAYFAAMSEPGRAKLLLMDASAVLNTQQLQQLSVAAGANELKAGLQALADQASVAVPVQELCELLSAAFDRAALAIATGADATKYQLAMQHLLASVVVKSNAVSPIT